MKRILSNLLMIIALSGISPRATAQNHYSFVQSQGNTYTDLTAATTVTSFGSNGLYIIPGVQGETFRFYGVPFTFGGLKTIAMGENPFLRIDDDTTLVILDGAFRTLVPVDSSSSKSYKIEGAPGCRVVKLQYRNYGLNSGQPGNFFNLQIWYFQGTGVIEFRYGPRSANNAGGYTASNGPNIGLFHARDDFSKMYGKLWVYGAPGSVVLDSAATLSFNAMTGIPPDGTIFRFIPRFMKVAGQYCDLPCRVPASPNCPGITQFGLNSINRSSAAPESTAGVIVNTGLQTTLERGSTYTLSLTHTADAINFPNTPNNLAVWIDFNANHSFDDAGEAIATASLVNAGTYTAAFTVPPAATLSTTRMRAAVKMAAPGNSFPSPCDDPAGYGAYQGEMEDYIIQLTEHTTGMKKMQNDADVKIFRQSGPGEIGIVLVLKKSANVAITVYDLTGRRIADVVSERRMEPSTQTFSYRMAPDRQARGLYLVRVQVDDAVIVRKVAIGD